MTVTDGRSGPQLDQLAYRRRQSKAFASARRHSKLVLFLKNAIPAGCIIALAAIVMFTFFDPFQKAETAVAVSTDGISGSKITMQNPKLSGYKKDLRSYDVTADTAVQEVKRPTLMELLKPIARIEIEKDKFAHVTARVGTYDSAAEKMRLEGEVSVRSDAGYDIRMVDANVDLKAGNMETPRPVEVTMTSGTIRADSMEVQDSGKVIFFRGHVVTMFDAVDTADAAQPKTGTESTPATEKKQ